MEFQRLVERILLRACRNDFAVIPVKGRRGDLSSDGFLHSRCAVVQVYAPDEKEIKKILAKVRRDFLSAKEKWKTVLREWIFVLNNEEGYGAPAEVHLLLAELMRDLPEVQLSLWSFDDLWRFVQDMSDGDIRDLLGSYPYDADGRVPPPDVHYVREIVTRLSHRADDDAPDDHRPVPASKLAHNRLSRVAANELRGGMIWSPVLETCWDADRRPDRRSAVAATLNAEYIRLRAHYPDAPRTPDLILADLRRFLGDERRLAETPYYWAVNIVLAHFFESCDIFERPPEET